MTNKKHITNCILFWLLLLAPSYIVAQQQARPNIIFIFTDDHANRTISAYDGSINRTPNMDRIASEGAIFRNSFCTNSICGPSRAAILTGQHSHKNGVTGNASKWDSTQQMLLPRILQQSGYRTALIGKWHLNSNPGSEFDYWKILMGAGRQGFYYNPDFVTSDGQQLTEAGYSTDIITRQSIHWLNMNSNSEKPFMLFVQYKSPHVPRMPPLRLLDKYQDDSIPEPATLFDDYATRERYAAEARMKIPYQPLPLYEDHDPKKNIYFARMTQEQLIAYHKVKDVETRNYLAMKAAGKLEGDNMKRYAYQQFIKDYLRCVDAVDENVGLLLNWLDLHPAIKENTIVIYASDQSYFTGEHGWAEKRFMYEEGMMMPLLMRWPGKIKPGTEVKALVQNIDYAPSLLHAAGIDIPVAMQGRSFLPVVTNQDTSDWRQAVYYHYYDHGDHGVPRHDGVRTNRYKLIHFYTDDTYELYDLQMDPHEINNLYNKAPIKNVQEEMKQVLTRLRKKYDVPDSVFKPPYTPKR